MEHLEGRQSILAALTARRRRFQLLLVGENAHAVKITDVLEAAETVGVPIKRVPASDLDAMSHGKSHGGMIAICTPRSFTSEDELLESLDRKTEPPLLLLVEGMEDARNVGFVLRSAEAFGAHAVLLKKHIWEFDATDISRASAGAYERLSLVRMDRESDLLTGIRRRGIRMFGCVPGTKRTIYDANLTGPVLLAVGGEKRGLSGAVRKGCDRFISIPMAGEGTSLSLTDAAAVVLSEAARQRRAGRIETTAMGGDETAVTERSSP